MQQNSYIASARKYRPISFKEVVGQKFITDTFDRAIKYNRLGQSLLFCGPRGVGKTSCARILSREINNINHDKINDSNFNIFELDAASNNSVDDIRNLISQIHFAPQQGKYKTYIIDEVHMLSQGAFNAFLKTLEEPPSYIIFILITTEKYKIPSTILSRCQIYEFKLISIIDIKLYIKNIAIKENITVEDEVLFLIAKQANGILRDALFLFDRLVSLSGKKLNKEIVMNNLCILDQEYYFNITNFFIQNNIAKVLLLFDEILQTGFDIELFIDELTTHFRNLLISKNSSTLSLLEFDQKTCENYINQSMKVPLNFLINSLELCKSLGIEYKLSKNPRLFTEITLIQLSSLSNNLYTKNQKKK